MTEKIIIAGAGGQGVMLLGKVLAEAAMRRGKFVTWIPSYGAEVRGGAAYCMVVISDEEIGSPYFEKADTLIAMNQISLEKFKARLKDKGLLVTNSKGAGKFIFTDIAVALGNAKVANMAALGNYLAKRKILKKEDILVTFEEITPKDKRDLIEINKQALLKGMELVKHG